MIWLGLPAHQLLGILADSLRHVAAGGGAVSVAKRTSGVHVCLRLHAAGTQCKVWGACTHSSCMLVRAVHKDLLQCPGGHLTQCQGHAVPEQQPDPASSTTAGRWDKLLTQHGLLQDASVSKQQLVVLTGIPTAPCSTPWGDHLISLATQVIIL